MTISESNPPSPAVESRVSRAGLSDLAVSPFGLPLALHAKEVRVAWVGRTSTEENQDPRQSLLRQLERSKVSLPESWFIVCHFYDVESGRMELEQRGRATDYERFDIPIARDGGIADLLTEAQQADRRFDVVICESMARTARKMYESLSVERALERAEVPVFAANEPIMLSGGRAQQILQRRINQSVAEYEVLNMLELSWGGTCTHVREGYNIGKPCYGYRAKKIRHPNPVKAEKGLTKTRLEPDGARAETVTLIAKWRYHKELGYDTIAERLNADLDKHPPPEPPGKSRARGAWSKSSVAEVLKNPKYTGYQVYNRRARRSRGGRNKPNPPELWVWSVEPAHEPLIPKWMFDAFNAASGQKTGSRDGPEPNVHRYTRRTYRYRSRVICDCGRRMMGHRHKRGYTYYRCWPTNNNRGRPDKHSGHPRTVYVREESINAVVEQAFSEFLFHPDRRTLLIGDMDRAEERASQERAERRARLQRRTADLARRQDNVLGQAENADPADPFTQGLRDRYNDLQAERQLVLDEIAELDAQDPAEPRRASDADLDVLDALPHLALNLNRAPEGHQQRLFELTKLHVQVHYPTHEATLVITLPREDLEMISTVATALQRPAHPPIRACITAKPQVEASVNAVRAPGAARTGCTRSPHPLSQQGRLAQIAHGGR
ncbi:recombinase family protein [Prauserella muralis]|uniref:recombinase family protein n=1 Tax=Prauserella muralis TaxID=588067 RepID=UPI0011AC79A9|nr:recombinase family protein [Prauserella muralis]TWE27586.1 recombinase-like zinc beta ribbon protein [Prauserella muralis]